MEIAKIKLLRKLHIWSENDGKYKIKINDDKAILHSVRIVVTDFPIKVECKLSVVC